MRVGTSREIEVPGSRAALVRQPNPHHNRRI
jgi:hypothetical protein